MKVLIDNKFNTEINTDKFGKLYDAKFVCETCIKNKHGSWINQPSLIFYSEEAHPEGSNYMALTKDPYKGWLISDGICVTEQAMRGIVLPGDVVTWSKFRHDYVEGGAGAIDGGRDYCKIVGDPKTVVLQILNGEVVIKKEL